MWCTGVCFGTLLTLLSVLQHAHALGYRIERHASCILAPGTLVDLYGLSCTDCARACSARAECVYVSYERYRTRCKLYRSDVSAYAKRGVGCVGMARSSIELTPVAAECTQCAEGQVCDVTANICPTVVCPQLIIDYGTVSGNILEAGARLRYTCNIGYRSAAGPRTAYTTCSQEGDWHPAAYCTDACGAPPTFPNSRLSYDSSGLFYECEAPQGFYEKDNITSAEMTLHCDLVTNTWTVSDFTCVKDCDYPPEVVNADIIPYTKKAGASVTYTCLYDVSSSFLATCEGFNGTWSEIHTCATCSQHLVDGIRDSDLTASDVFNHPDPVFHAPRQARLSSTPSLYSAGAWVASIAIDVFGTVNLLTPDEPFIQARFSTLKHVVGVITAGRTSLPQWVKSYAFSFSRDCTNFYYVRGADNAIQEFPANTDGVTLHTNFLPWPISAKCVRIHPITFHLYVSLRFDIIGCADRCSTYLVSGPSGVDDASITASSHTTVEGMAAPPSQARLDSQSAAGLYGGWAVTSVNPDIQEHIQVQFDSEWTVSSIVTQGMHGKDARVTSYRVAYSRDCVTFANLVDHNNNNIVFPGNSDSDSRVENVLPRVVKARCVRLLPVEYNLYIGLRFDIKGCQTDHVCPVSPARFITPNITSSLALRIMPGEYTKSVATSLCQEHGQLVLLDTAEKQAQIATMIQNCPQTADQWYWVDGVASIDQVEFSDGSKRAYQFWMNQVETADHEYWVDGVASSDQVEFNDGSKLWYKATQPSPVSPTRETEKRVVRWDWGTGIQKLLSSRFSCEDKGAVYVREDSTMPERRVVITRPGTVIPGVMPDIFPPAGLSRARQEYLYKNLRPYVRPQHQDTTCPGFPEIGHRLMLLDVYI